MAVKYGRGETRSDAPLVEPRHGRLSQQSSLAACLLRSRQRDSLIRRHCIPSSLQSRRQSSKTVKGGGRRGYMRKSRSHPLHGYTPERGDRRSTQKHGLHKRRQLLTDIAIDGTAKEEGWLKYNQTPARPETPEVTCTQPWWENKGGSCPSWLLSYSIHQG